MDVNEIDLTDTVAAVATHIGVAILRNTYKGAEGKVDFSSTVNQFINSVGKPRDKMYNASGTETNISDCYQDVLTAAIFLRSANMLYHTSVRPPLATFAGGKCPSGSSGNVTFIDHASPYVLSDMPSDDPDLFNDISMSGDTTNPFWFIAKDRGYSGNNIRLAIMDKATQDLVLARDVSVTSWATYNVFAAVDSRITDYSEFVICVEILEQGKIDNASNWERVEFFRVSLNEDQTDDQGRNIFAANVINEQSRYIRVAVNPVFTNPTNTINISTNAYQQLADGADHGGDTVSDGDIMTAIDLYSNPEEIDVNIFLDSNKSETVKQYLISTCELNGGRGDCVAIIDCKYDAVVNNTGSEVDDLVNWRRGLDVYITDNLNVNSSYGAVYGNWAEIYDKWSQKYRWIPLCGHVGGVFAHTDDVNDPWYAPAGLRRAILQNIRRLGFNPSKGDRDLLYLNGINPVVSFAGQGKVIWGQKTLYDRESAFNRVNVRRLFIVLEKAISTSAKYFLFEPNTEFTRVQMVNMIEPFLRDVKARQGIYDYLVVCDDSNNTPERIDRNELWADIYIKPVRAAEFIVLNFIATKTGADFTEIAALRAA